MNFGVGGPAADATSTDPAMAERLTSFSLQPGRRVGRRYIVERRLGGGSEGEVYQIHEVDTGIQRAAKLYFPHVDPQHKLSIRHARKLNALRHCPIVLQYHHSEVVIVRGQRVVALISDLCEGEPLEKWIARHRGKHLPSYTALHVLYSLARGLEAIHTLGEYHADVHSQNILIQPRGVRFDMKLIDFYDWGRPAAYKQKQDLVDSIKVFYECLGGRSQYSKQPQAMKTICAGLKRDLILKRFPTISALRLHLETFEWDESP